MNPLNTWLTPVKVRSGVKVGSVSVGHTTKPADSPDNFDAEAPAPETRRRTSYGGKRQALNNFKGAFVFADYAQDRAIHRVPRTLTSLFPSIARSIAIGEGLQDVVARHRGKDYHGIFQFDDDTFDAAFREGVRTLTGWGHDLSGLSVPTTVPASNSAAYATAVLGQLVRIARRIPQDWTFSNANPGGWVSVDPSPATKKLVSEAKAKMFDYADGALQLFHFYHIQGLGGARGSRFSHPERFPAEFGAPEPIPAESPIEPGFSVVAMILAASNRLTAKNNGVTFPYYVPRNAVTVTSDWGSRRISNGSSFHRGLDLAAASGTPLFAPFDGRVIDTGRSMRKGKKPNWGRWILIERDSDGAVYRMAHLSKIFVDEDQLVRKGMIIGATGSDQTDKAHLHVEYYPPSATPPYVSHKTADPKLDRDASYRFML